jgi:hypothetical protein
VYFAAPNEVATNEMVRSVLVPAFNSVILFMSSARTCCAP